MIAVLKNGTSQKQIDSLINWIESQGLSVHLSTGEYQTIVGLIGDTTKIDEDLLQSLDIVETVKRISEPFKSANRKFHPDDTVIHVGNTTVGGGSLSVMAGPCSVESEEQVIEIARAVKAAGATMLRGGAFKPRTSPYDFQGLKAEGIDFLLEAKKETGLPIVTEIMNANHLPLFEDVDVIQVGARNMQNFELLKELTHLPVIVDPSHATGSAKLVKPMALAAAACGAHGLMIEVHNNPKAALCDGAQSLTPDQFADVMSDVMGLVK